MQNIVGLCIATQASLEDQTNRVLIEADRRATKASDKDERQGGDDIGGTHRAAKTLRDQGGELDPRVKVEI